MRLVITVMECTTMDKNGDAGMQDCAEFISSCKLGARTLALSGCARLLAFTSLLILQAPCCHEVENFANIAVRAHRCYLSKFTL